MSIMHQLLDKVKENIDNKAIEYSMPGDRWQNFNYMTQMSRKQITPLESMRILSLKHEYSLDRMIKEYDQQTKLPSDEMILEKLGDLMTYITLIAMYFEEKKSPPF